MNSSVSSSVGRRTNIAGMGACAPRAIRLKGQALSANFVDRFAQRIVRAPPSFMRTTIIDPVHETRVAIADAVSIRGGIPLSRKHDF
ncbi:MAG: hypothetical protein ABI277_09455 [Burkholderiaceae bacterium]